MPSLRLGLHNPELFFVQDPALAASVPTMLMCVDQHAMHRDGACWTFVLERLVPLRCTALSLMSNVADAQKALQQHHC